MKSLYIFTLILLLVSCTETETPVEDIIEDKKEKAKFVVYYTSKNSLFKWNNVQKQRYTI